MKRLCLATDETDAIFFVMATTDIHEFALGFTELMVACENVFDIPAEGRKALSARLKHLQGKNFPDGVNVGRTKRVRYDAAAITGTMLVLALTASFMPPLVAVEIVREQWAGWAHLVANAAWESKQLHGGGRKADPTYALIETNALAGLGLADASEGRAAMGRGRRKMHAVSSSELGRVTRRAGAVPCATMVLDVSALIDRLSAHLMRCHGISAERLARELIAIDKDGASRMIARQTRGLIGRNACLPSRSA